MKNDIPYKWESKESWSRILISDKIDFKIKSVARDKERHCIMIKRSIQEEDITIINNYEPHQQYIRQRLTTMKGEINSNTIIVGDFNNPLTPRNRSSGQRINKGTQALNHRLEQIDLTDVFRTFHSKRAEYTFFSKAHRTFSRIDHILGHKSSLSEFKNTEIILRNFFDHNTIRLDINYRKKKCKQTQTREG